MKKRLILFVFAFLPLMFSGCSEASDTTTDYARDYIYKAEETINFYDENHSRELLGTLCIVSMQTLSDQPFTIREQDGTNSENEPVYKETAYSQIVQINYTYIQKGGKMLNAEDMRVYDVNHNRGLLNPETEYTKIPVNNMKSFVIALPDYSDTIMVEVYYSGVFSPNAKVSLSTADQAINAPSSSTTGDSKQQKINELQSKVDRLETDLLEAQAQVDALTVECSGLNAQINEMIAAHQFSTLCWLVGIIIVSGLAILFFVLWLVLLVCKNKNKYNQ